MTTLHKNYYQNTKVDLDISTLEKAYLLTKRQS